jgi:hypothetical protein
MSMLHRMAAVGTTVAMLTIGTALFATPASAASLGRCTPSNVVTTDPYGHRFTVRTTCTNQSPAPVYAATNHGFKKGEVRSTRSWFLCWRVGTFDNDGRYGGSSYWYYTHGDRYFPGARNSWGFVPSSYLDTQDPAAGIPQCGFTSVPR